MLKSSKIEKDRNEIKVFVPKRYCIPARTFLGVPGRSALQPITVPDHLHERSIERFRSFVTFLRLEKLKNSHETFRNGQKR
jgi:hypothetical protein